MTNKHLGILRRLDLLSSIDVFEHLTLKNVRWLLDSLSEEHFSAGQIVGNIIYYLNHFIPLY